MILGLPLIPAFLGPNFVSWSSKKQPLTTRSTIEVEYGALDHTTLELLWL